MSNQFYITLFFKFQGIIDYYGDDKDDFLGFAGPGGWNDPDMLVVGNFGLSYDQAKVLQK